MLLYLFSFIPVTVFYGVSLRSSDQPASQDVRETNFYLVSDLYDVF